MAGPLKGVRVLDLSRVLAGPFCAMILGDLGAEVIKVERPGVGDETRAWGPPYVGGESAYYLCANRNKKSITLNLKTEEGRRILRELILRSDVVIENFRTGTMEGWGLGYEDLKPLHPGLIYCKITGYGSEGPARDRPGYDFILQAESGWMSITGPVEGPPFKVGVAVVDVVTALFAVIAILAALAERSRSGHGQKVKISLLECALASLVNVASNYLVSGVPPRRYGNAHPNIVPYEAFETADGYIVIAVGNDSQFRALCECIGRAELAEDPRFATNSQRVMNRDLLIPILREIIRRRSTQEWLRALLPAGVPAGAVRTIPEALSDPQAQALNMVVEVPHPRAGRIRMIRSPLNFSRTPVAIIRHPPILGEHTQEVLVDLLGYEPEAIDQLRAQEII
jgi:formyl-CoA transferase